MLNPKQRDFRVSKLAEDQRNLLHSIEGFTQFSGSLEFIASMQRLRVNETLDQRIERVEKQLGLLVDEALVSRTKGDRETAIYRAV